MSETQRRSGVAAWSQSNSCLCSHVAVLSLQAEKSVAALTGAQNKLNSEIADVRVAAAKMSSINEALALDKVELNKLVLQVSRVSNNARRSPPAARFFSDFVPSDSMTG